MSFADPYTDLEPNIADVEAQNGGKSDRLAALAAAATNDAAPVDAPIDGEQPSSSHAAVDEPKHDIVWCVHSFYSCIASNCQFCRKHEEIEPLPDFRDSTADALGFDAAHYEHLQQEAAAAARAAAPPPLLQVKEEEVKHEETIVDESAPSTSTLATQRINVAPLPPLTEAERRVAAEKVCLS